MKTKQFFLIYLLAVLTVLSFDVCYPQGFHTSVTSPDYKGGITALKEFINRNIRYSGESDKNGIPATVTLSYTINENGKVENIKILRGINAECDSEAVRITQLVPGWQAAVQWGKPVSVRVVMPVKFYIKENNRKDKSVTISGIVTGKATGNPIEGTLILAKGSSAGTVTDKKGYYSLVAPGEEFELEYTSLGYERKTEKIGKNRTVNVELLPEDINIDFSSSENK